MHPGSDIPAQTRRCRMEHLVVASLLHPHMLVSLQRDFMEALMLLCGRCEKLAASAIFWPQAERRTARRQEAPGAVLVVQLYSGCGIALSPISGNAEHRHGQGAEHCDQPDHWSARQIAAMDWRTTTVRTTQMCSSIEAVGFPGGDVAGV